MKNFGDPCFNYSELIERPTITCMNYSWHQEFKVSRIVNLADDLSLSLATSDIRIEAPIPGKGSCRYVVPNLR